MANDEVFVKRVDFEVNNNETKPLNGNGTHPSDVETAEKSDDKATCMSRFCYYIDKLGVKSAMSHIGLLLSLGLFCLGGGWVFVKLERPALMDRENLLRENSKVSRDNFLMSLNETVTSDEFDKNTFMEELEKQLVIYEAAAQEAVEGNLALKQNSEMDGKFYDFPPKDNKWNLEQAVFFASTVCTTIGYGNIVPETFEGRLFCIFFAIIGIPFTLTVIADYGNLFANSVSWTAKRCKSMKLCNKDSKLRKFKGRKWLYAIGAVIFLGFYLAAGAVVFDLYEDGWTFFDGFYFSFITVTTVGFGDLVPGDYLMLYCTLYILIGLALTSTIIELVRRQYVQSWQRLQQMKLGSFAESLKRLGEAHGAIDVNDLKSILSVVSMPKRDKKTKKGGDTDEMDTLEALTKAILREVKVKTIEKPQLVQIIIYESSV